MRRTLRRAATLAAFSVLCALLFACPPSEVPRGSDAGDGQSEHQRDGGSPPHVEEPGDIEVVIATAAAHPLGAPLSLDGSGSSQTKGRLLTYAWSVSAPGGESCTPELGDVTRPTLTFTPLCEGAHDVTLVASTVDGESEQETARVDIVQVRVAFGEIVPASRGRSAEVFVTIAQGAIPSDVLTLVLEATPRAPFTEAPEVSGDGNPSLVPMLDPLATYDLVARVLADDVVVSEADASATVTALNSAPVVSNLRLEDGPLPFGGAATLLADVSDPEGDDVTCEAGVSAGDAAGLVLTPSVATPEDGVCAFALSAPPRLEQWTLTVTADDGNATSPPATLDVQPENDPPSLSVSVEGASSRGYACSGAGACASEPFTLALAMADDIDANDALEVTIESDEATLPEGVTLVVEPHATDAGKRVVRFASGSYGPLKGVWPVTVTVTEATALDDLVASTSQTVELEVTNLTPTAVALPGANTHHSYTAAAGYTGTLRFEANVSDPEHSSLELVATVMSCPTAAAGASACGGAELELELVESSVDAAGKARVRYAVRASSLAALVGTYTLDLTVTDPDGGSVTVGGLTSSLLNRAPVIVATRTIQHAHSGGQYRASFTAMYVDPDGDPLTTDLEVRCPGGQTRALGQGCNGTTPIVTASGGDVTISSVGGSASGFVGAFQLRGTISDGIDTVGAAGTTVSTLTVQNQPPAPPVIVPGTSKLRCDHKTTNGTVTNDPECTFLVTANGSDPDGDPTRLRLRTNAAYTFVNASPTPLTTTTPRSRSFELQATFNAYKANRTPTLLAYHEDAFGAQSAEVAVEVELLNRAPVWGSSSTITPRKTAGAYGVLETRGYRVVGTTLVDTYEDFTTWHAQLGNLSPLALGRKPCPIGGLCGTDMPFTLTLDVTDPDGDPLEVLPLMTCNPGTLSPMLGSGVLGAWRPMQATFTPRLAWRPASCAADYVEADIALLSGSVYGIRCTLDVLTAASDQIETTRMVSPKTRMWRVPAGANVDSCTL